MVKPACTMYTNAYCMAINCRTRYGREQRAIEVTARYLSAAPRGLERTSPGLGSSAKDTHAEIKFPHRTNDVNCVLSSRRRRASDLHNGDG